jgi:prolipoprotein diacylglyceryl transferase
MQSVWDIDPVLISFQLPFGQWQVRYYGLIFALTFLLGFALFFWQEVRSGESPDEPYHCLLPGFIGLVLGARLGHVLFYNLNRFLSDPAWLFRIWEGGLSSHGAACGLFLALIYHSRRRHKPFWDLCDRFSFSAALGAAMIRIGNLFNSEIVGKITDASWGIRFPRYDLLPADICPARYPTQIMEAVWGYLVLASLFSTDLAFGREKRPRGLLSALFLVLYFSGRIMVEFFKERQGPSDNLFLSKGQLLSLVPLLLGLILMARVFWKISSEKTKKKPA